MKTLLALAAAQAALYVAIAGLSTHFDFDTNPATRPLPEVLGLFGAAFILYLLSLAAALKAPPGRRLAALLLVASVVFRIVLLPTLPIQEIDIYRYLWDGAATASGLSPYRYAPAQLLAGTDEAESAHGLKPYLRLRDRVDSLDQTLRRIHFPELTTLYPPVSQVVFALGDRLTPRDASLRFRMVTLKGVLLLFDFGTIVVLLGLLRSVSLHPGWSVAYAWCPLVLKEYANSGHLDCIAVFLTAAAALAAVRAARSHAVGVTRGVAGWMWGLGAAVLLGFAVGAKLYPLVLLPVFFAWAASSRGPLLASLLTAATLGVALPLLLPMFAFGAAPPSPHTSTAVRSSAAVASTSDHAQPVPLLPPPAHTATGDGLTTFLTRWEMNDFLFMVALENIRPDNTRSNAGRPWFVVVPDGWRAVLVASIADRLGQDPRTTSFLLARLLSVWVLGVLVVWMSWRVYRHPNAQRFLEACFLSLAWLWLLAPTQNPWYWTWAVPFLPFARGRAWYAVSGLTMVYYARFWFQLRYPSAPVWGTPYTGAEAFDFVVVPLEFLPWLALLAAAAIRRQTSGATEETRESV